jgi:hypothetical protein
MEVGKSAKFKAISQGIPECDSRRKRRQNPPKTVVFASEHSITTVNYACTRKAGTYFVAECISLPSPLIAKRLYWPLLLLTVTQLYNSMVSPIAPIHMRYFTIA